DHLRPARGGLKSRPRARRITVPPPGPTSRAVKCRLRRLSCRPRFREGIRGARIFCSWFYFSCALFKVTLADRGQDLRALFRAGFFAGTKGWPVSAFFGNLTRR